MEAEEVVFAVAGLDGFIQCREDEFGNGCGDTTLACLITGELLAVDEWMCRRVVWSTLALVERTRGGIFEDGSVCGHAQSATRSVLCWSTQQKIWSLG